MSTMIVGLTAGMRAKPILAASSRTETGKNATKMLPLRTSTRARRRGENGASTATHHSRVDTLHRNNATNKLCKLHAGRGVRMVLYINRQLTLANVRRGGEHTAIMN